MVSMLEANDSSINNDSPMETVVPKSEPPRDASVSSAVSTPEAEVETLTQDVVQTQKRKGGRKPIYATSEERKQRNRQAQAAFRERRTEYIKQLETTIKHNEETLQSLQQSHRSAADECLMLRYKNSLLERILLEKGIDVQAELRLKSAAPGMAPVKPNTMVPKQPAPLDRTAIHRNSLTRQKAGIVPKPDLPGMSQQHREGAYGVQSPQLQPTPSSHVSSPSTARSPGFGLSGAMSPTSTEFQTQQQQQQQQHGRPPLLPQQRSFNQGPSSMGMASSDSMEPATSQSMMAGEQEYDAQADLLDDHDQDDTVNAGSFVPDFNQPPAPNGSRRLGMPPHFNSQTGEVDQNAYGGSNNPLFGQYEPMLDTDPFGLNASMHFQTPYSYEQNQHLRQ
ncbi:hypothetical protein DTO169E5_6706 [Paecilomyces variotii]|nr:hypothetical protein DTO169E5_6706 [Paecilomyces variotii]